MILLHFLVDGEYIPSTEFSDIQYDNLIRSPQIKAIKDGDTLIALIHTTPVGYRVWRRGEKDSEQFYTIATAIKYGKKG